MYINRRAEELLDALKRLDVKEISDWIKSEKDINAPQNCLDFSTGAPLFPFQMAARCLKNRQPPSASLILDQFIQLGADINKVCEDGSTALSNALEWDSHWLIDYLIKNGVNVNTQDQKGETVFHKFGRRDQTKGLKISLGKLLPLNPDFNIQDKDGNTPLHLACNFRMVVIMRKQGARLDIANNEGQYPDQSLAKSYGGENTVTKALKNSRIAHETRTLKQTCALSSRKITAPKKRL